MSRNSALGLVLVVAVSAVSAKAETEGEVRQVSFRDIRRDGKVKVIGKFGLPVGETVTLEGRRAKASMTSDSQTLEVASVNGSSIEPAEKRKWTSDIQVRNIGELPKGTPISVKGFEVLSWAGTPETNWHTETYFVVTEVLAPKTMKVTPWNW